MTHPPEEEIIQDNGYWLVSTHRFVFGTAPAFSVGQQETVATSEIASFKVEGRNFFLIALETMMNLITSLKWDPPTPARRFVLNLKSGKTVKTAWHSYYPEHQKLKFDGLEKALGEALGRQKG